MQHQQIRLQSASVLTENNQTQCQLIQTLQRNPIRKTV